MSIPKIIHYCWFGGNDLPESAKKCIDSWKKNCPDYEIKCWNEESFDISSVKYVKEAYESKRFAFVSDYVRLFALYNCGGIYFDTDVELLKPIDNLLPYKGFIATEKGAPTPYGRRILVNTGSGVGAEPKNSVIKAMLDLYEKVPFVKETGDFDTMPCTVRCTNALENIGFESKNEMQVIDDFAFLPVDFFSPFDFMTHKTSITENTYGIHYYNNSWNEPISASVLKNRLKCSPLGMLFMRFKYGWRKKLRNSRRVLKNRHKLRCAKTFNCSNLTFGDNILFDKELVLRLGRDTTVEIGNSVESDGKLSIITDGYGKLKIGNNVYFNDGVIVSCLGCVTIGDDTLFGPGVKVFDNNHIFDVSGVFRDCREGVINIGKKCWIASNVVILKGADIGDGCVIGAGCVIKDKIPAGSIVTAGGQNNIQKIK